MGRSWPLQSSPAAVVARGRRGVAPIQCQQETHFKRNDISSFKVEGWKQIYRQNATQNRAKVAVINARKSGLHSKANNEG